MEIMKNQDWMKEQNMNIVNNKYAEKNLINIENNKGNVSTLIF